MAGYSPLLAEAVSSLPPKYDFVSDGLSSEERGVLDAADSRLFSNPSFLESRWGPDNWPSELKLASFQAVPLLMKEIDIRKKSDGKHVVRWEVDSLDRILDDSGVYPDMCVHCYGKTGYDTYEGISENYDIIIDEGHVHREMLKHFAYFAKAGGEGILVRSFMENDADDFEMLYKRKIGKYFPNPIGVGSFAYENVSFMSQIELPDGKRVTYPTTVFDMVGDAKTEREAVERIYDYMRKKLTHFTGDDDDFADIYRPYTTTPYAPQLGWIVHVGEAGSPSACAVITGALRAVGLKAEQFQTPRNIRRAGSVEVDGQTYFYNGNVFLGRESATADLCNFFQTLDEVENRTYCER